MYIYIMSHRLQITLTDEQYAFLDAEANSSSVSMAELIRRALDTAFGPRGERPLVRLLHMTGRRTGRTLDAS